MNLSMDTNLAPPKNSSGVNDVIPMFGKYCAISTLIVVSLKSVLMVFKNLADKCS